jgi:pimeloyl-ACP methyl ester carboxylesterase
VRDTNTRWLAATGALLAGLIAGGAPVRASQPGCDGADIHHVSVPVDHDDPAGPHFGLAFRVRAGAAPDAPLVIVVPGGPGGTLIREDRYARSGGLPDDFAVVLTDPRGGGCNDDPALTVDRDLSSEFLARDLLAIVAELESERGERPLRYLLYGQSYGTVEATIAANLAPRLGVTPPQAVVMEGTLGHAFLNYAEYFASFQAEWHEVRDALPRKWQALIHDNKLDIVPTVPSAAWALLVNNDLMRGYHPDGEHELARQLSPDGMPWLLTALKMFSAMPEQDALATHNRLLRVIGCGELYGDLYPLRDLRDGELVLRGQNLCSDYHGVSRPYDANDWPLAMPIVYIQGERDPATSYPQARYHFAAQASAARYFIHVDLAAHAALSVTLNVGDCPARLWGAIATDLAGLPQAVARCDALESKARVAMEYEPSAVARLARN